MKRIVVAIDGPAGAGKSTISRIIAKRLNIEYIDTGAMYRAVTLKALNMNININDDFELEKLLNDTSIVFEDSKLLLDNVDVSVKIRMPEINERVSEIATKFIVRKKLVELQRQMSLNRNVIMDGRDIGTYVLVNANFKIYLTASVKERAERRYLELKEKGVQVNFDEVFREIEERDLKDTTREFNPLKKAEDAVLVNTTGKDINEVVEEILGIINNSKEN